MGDVTVDKRVRLGLVFNFHPSWMGGIIYLLNLVKTLDFLDDKKKPEILVFYRPDLKDRVHGISYPYLSLYEWNFPSAWKGSLRSWLKGRNMFYEGLISTGQVDVLYPAWDFPVRNKTKVRIIAWYADLQHKYYPEFFTRLNILQRNIRLKLMLRNADDLVVSSEAVKQDFHRYYRVREDMNMPVYHFVSILDILPEENFEEIRRKYDLPEDYFLVSNQFHKHKNHRVVLQAMAEMKGKGKVIHMAITGKFPKASDSPYLAELHQLINENGLREQISLLGVIPRAEQLLIMKHARAVVQPSLFEGWSTVIEDAKSLQVPVIAAALPVNKEQLGDRGSYFDPLDAGQLGSLLMSYPDREPGSEPYAEYQVRVKQAAERLLSIFTEVPIDRR